jgi:NAD(P) transhydrogenase subunit alpha
VLLGAGALGRFFPLLMTAAGTIAPARVFVIGAGVAGLQAIATARRLGAVVEAFDVRPAVREEVQSLGATFVAAELADAGSVAAGGYAKAQSQDQEQLTRERIRPHVAQADVVISTANVPGRRAPVLISTRMVREMKPGSVVVDLAAEGGGNCELTRPGETVHEQGVSILGPVNLAATLPFHASQMYARNVLAFVQLMVKDGALKVDFADDILDATCVTHAGQSRLPGASPTPSAPALAASEARS